MKIIIKEALMRKPAHPGQVLLDGFIESNNIKIKALADHLGFLEKRYREYYMAKRL